MHSWSGLFLFWLSQYVLLHWLIAILDRYYPTDPAPTDRKDHPPAEPEIPRPESDS